MVLVVSFASVKLQGLVVKHHMNHVQNIVGVAIMWSYHWHIVHTLGMVLFVGVGGCISRRDFPEQHIPHTSKEAPNNETGHVTW